MELTSVEYLNKKALPFRETVIIPLADIQLQQRREAVDIKRLKETVQWGVDHDAWWIGVGDYIDMESPSNRKLLRGTGFYDSVLDALDAKAEELQEELQDILKPTRKHWLGILDGHHYHEYQDGGTSDTRLAQYLDAPFLGTCAAVKVVFELPAGVGGSRTHHVNPSFNIWAHHGRGGGKLSSAPINSLEHIVKGFDSDVYLIAHTHRAGAVRMARIYPQFGPKKGYLEHKDLFLAACGSFLKGYAEGHQRGGRAAGMYPEAAMMNPLSLGVVKIWARPRWEIRPGGTTSGSPVIDLSVEV